ncbi:MAG: hypothetical protein JXM70_10815 [Pirellulales bacterium]|nr:hypothetical protein [Pirellulales bacterium]
MSRKEKLPPELIAFEAELASLRPDTGSLDMGRLMFLAGQESVAKRKRPWTKLAWPAAFTAMTVAATVLLVMLVNRSQPEVVERIVRVEVPVQDTAPQTLLVTSPENRPDNEAPIPEIEMAIAKSPLSETHVSLIDHSSSTFGRLAAVFFKQDQASQKPDIDRNRSSYRELREYALTQGIENWPIVVNGHTRSKQNKPISRQALTKALLGDEG